MDWIVKLRFIAVCIPRKFNNFIRVGRRAAAHCGATALSSSTTLPPLPPDDNVRPAGKRAPYIYVYKRVVYYYYTYTSTSVMHVNCQLFYATAFTTGKI